MKELIEYDRVVVYLDKISDYIRTELFDNNLSKPIITLQKKTGTHGHFETLPMWKDAEGNERYEININSETVTRPIENVVATLIHEYCHYYNQINGIQDCSRNGYYHNKKFKECAEKHMLRIEHDDRIGWSITYPTEELINWVISHDLQDIKLGRGINWMEVNGTMIPVNPKTGNGNKGNKTKSNMRKYTCNCGTIIRATKDLNGTVECNKCHSTFVEN